MDQIIGGLMETTLKKFIQDFKREQANISILKGRGVLRNLVVKCEEINQYMTHLPVSGAGEYYALLYNYKYKLIQHRYSEKNN